MFKVEIETDNAAFGHWPAEVARILRATAALLEEAGLSPDKDVSGALLDNNGNTVGEWKYETMFNAVED